MNSLSINARRFLQMLWVDTKPIARQGLIGTGTLFLFFCIMRLADVGLWKTPHFMAMLGLVVVWFNFYNWGGPGHQYLLLPCGRLAKFLSLFTISTIGLLLLWWVIYKFSAVPLYSGTPSITYFFRLNLSKAATTFFAVQPVFLISILYFHGRTGPAKTYGVVLLVLLGAALCTIAGLFFFGIEPVAVGGFSMSMTIAGRQINAAIASENSALLEHAARIIFPWVEAPVLWVIAYIRFREIEA